MDETKSTKAHLAHQDQQPSPQQPQPTEPTGADNPQRMSSVSVSNGQAATTEVQNALKTNALETTAVPGGSQVEETAGSSAQIAIITSENSEKAESKPDAPKVTRRKSSMTPVGSKHIRTPSTERHVTLSGVEGHDPEAAQEEARKAWGSSKDLTSEDPTDEKTKAELSKILAQFDPVVDINKDDSNRSENDQTLQQRQDNTNNIGSDDDTEKVVVLDKSISTTLSNLGSSLRPKKSKSGKDEEPKEPPSSAITGSKEKTTSSSSTTVEKALPETPKVKELPFDFHRFLEQLRHRSAIPITKYFQSFLKEFHRRPWTVNEQIKIIHDFLDFIAPKLEMCELWRNVSDQEFENLKEGMEKLVMNRLAKLTFSPSTTDDAERDEVLSQKIQIFRWIREEHLDIPVSPHNEAYLKHAQTELRKINDFKAPRDKVICILNCCKFIFTLIRRSEGSAKGADTFLPILIYVVLRSNPPQLVSNVQYISRFRNPEKLQAEAGYYLASLMGAISFIENLEVTSLSITHEEFDRQIEVTMQELSKERQERESAELQAAGGGSSSGVPAVSKKPVISYQNVIPHNKQQPHVASPALNSSPSASSIARNNNGGGGIGFNDIGDAPNMGSSDLSPSLPPSLTGSFIRRNRSSSQSSSLNEKSSILGTSPSILNPAAALFERGANFASRQLQKPINLVEKMLQELDDGEKSADDDDWSKPTKSLSRRGQPQQQQQQLPQPMMPDRPVQGRDRHDSFTDFVYVPTGEYDQRPSPQQPQSQNQQQQTPHSPFSPQEQQQGFVTLRPVLPHLSPQQQQQQQQQQHQSPQYPMQQNQSFPGNNSFSSPAASHQRERTISGQGQPQPQPQGSPMTPQQQQQQLQQQQQQQIEAQRKYMMALDTLTAMFPGCERQVCDVILQANEGRLSPSIDTLLEISSTGSPTTPTAPPGGGLMSISPTPPATVAEAPAIATVTTVASSPVLQPVRSREEEELAALGDDEEVPGSGGADDDLIVL